MIVRVHRRENPFTQIERATLQDKRLSWKARGLLAYLLSMPNDWTINFKHLSSQAPDGEYAVRSAFEELEKHGYALLERLRTMAGKFAGTEWVVYESPELQQSNSKVSKLQKNNIPTEIVVSPISVNPPTSEKPPTSEDLPTSEKSLTTNKTDKELQIRKQHTDGVAAASIDKRDGGPAGLDDGEVVRLVKRGLDRPMAERLVGQFGPERVARQIENYDRECQRKQENPPTPGWLVCAIQQDFAVREMTCSLMTYDEMLRWCEANGGLHRTTEFESEKQAYGTTLFRRRRLPGE